MNWLLGERFLALLAILVIGLVATLLTIKVSTRASLLLFVLLLTSCTFPLSSEAQLTPSAYPPPLSQSASTPSAYPEPQHDAQDRPESPATSTPAAYPAPPNIVQSTAAPTSAAYPAPLSAATSTPVAYPEPQKTATSAHPDLPTAQVTATSGSVNETAIEITPTSEPITTVMPSPTATPTSKPSTTLIPSPSTTPTQVLSPTPSRTAPPLPGGGFRDDFNLEMSENWKWYYPDENYVSLKLSPDFLRIYPLAGGLPDGKPRNLFLVNTPQGNFQISTRLFFEPDSNYQFAGLLIYQDLRNALQFGVGFADCAVPTSCLGRALYFSNYQDGVPGTQTIATFYEATDQIYLRLLLQGKNYHAEYSLDGVEWLEAGILTNPLSPDWVGLFAGQSESGFNPAIYAEFDYFSLSLLP